MEIGGTDYVIETPRPVELMELAVRWLMARWPECVVQNTIRRSWTAFHLIPLGREDEFFVFKDLGALADAAEDPRGLDVIHLLRLPGELTVVTDLGSAVGETLVAVLRSTKFPGAL